MSQALLQMLACGAPSQVIYANDVFSAYTYTGNGSTQTITNGIDLSGQGGMVWIKGRSGATDHQLFDTERTATYELISNSTAAQTVDADTLTAFNSDGFALGADATTNTNTATYVNWTFRKAPKFFDVVTWTGNSTPRTIAHSLGSAPGMIMVKKTNTADSWYVYHRSLGNGGVLYLEQIAAAGTGSSYWNSTDPTASVFSVGGNTGVNGTGNTYVAYLFAHDTAADGIIQCGGFNISGGARTTVSLGWEPQYLLMKSSTGAEVWEVLDNTRGLTTDSTAAMLQPNSSAAESPAGTSMGARLTATGFTAQPSNGTYIYLAIRRPNKPPTLGTQVYQAIARTGTGAAATVTGVGFAPDLVMPFNRSGVAGVGHPVYDRLRGALKSLRANLTNAENTDTASLTGFGVDGITVGADGGEFINSSRESSIINHFFKRAPGVLDVVCYTGTGVAHTESHNLGVVPELIITKSRSNTYNWEVGHVALGTTGRLRLNTTGIGYDISAFWTAFTSSGFTLTTASDVNLNAATFVAYLFATKAGISKVGSYTGNGTTNAIDCGFTTGARLVLIKRTDSTGDWYVWDTVRGIIAGNDPYLLLNSTAAEVTSTDYIDPSTAGFELSSTAPAAINASGGTFIFLAFA